MHRRRLPLLAAVAATAVLGGTAGAGAIAAPASASTISYQATIEVDYLYEYGKHSQSNAPGHRYSMTEEGTFSGHLKSVNPFVQFEDGKILPYRAGNGGFHAETAGSSTTVIKDEWSGDSRTTCLADGTVPYLRGRSSLGPTAGGGIGVRIFDELEVAETCEGSEPSTNGMGLHNEGVESDEDDFVGPFDASADWSPDTIGPPPGAGKVVQLVKSEVSDPEHCPGEDDSGTFTSCKFNFQGTITYVRQDLVDTDGVEPAPTTPTTPATPTTPSGPATNPASEDAMAGSVSDAIQDYLHPPAPPAPAPVDTGSPMADSVSNAIQQYLHEARTSVTTDRAQVEITCPVLCAGKLSAEAVARQNVANGTPLGSVVFHDLASTRAAMTAGAAATPTKLRATLRFSKADRRALKRRRFVVLTLRVTPVGAAEATVVRKVVRGPRRR